MIQLILLLACASDGQVSLSPAHIDWGEVDFQQEMPNEGYDARSVELLNTGSTDLDLEIDGFDSERLVLGATLVQQSPPTLPTLSPGSALILTVGVGDYLDGERDTVVEGSFTIGGPDVENPAELGWAFVPIRDLSEDTGF